MRNPILPVLSLKPMVALVDPGPMQLKAEQTAEALARPGTFAWMVGGQGSGRDIVLNALQTRFPEELAVVRMAPLSSADAVGHARLQLAVHARKQNGSLNLQPGFMDAELEASLRLLQERNQILVLRTHPSWEEGVDSVEQTIADRAATLVRKLGLALKVVPYLRVLVLASSPRQGALRNLGQLASHEFALTIPQITATALADEAPWRGLQEPFRLIRDGLAGHRPTPPQLRLGVALVALGDPLAEVVQLLRLLVRQEQPQLEPLIKRLRPLLARSTQAPLLRRAALARFSLPWDKLLAAVPSLGNMEDLVRVGLGYETSDGRVRLSEPVRRALLSEAAQGGKLAEADLETHARFEQAWTQLDGALSPETLEPRKVIPWLEKMHHRAHAGGHTREQLERLDLPAPEFYWDVGRALSREQERFEDAAIVYQRCWTRFQSDDYAHHYYAWNLDRVAQKPERIEEHYEKAIELRPDNVWWHARFCTFLIHRARFRDAETAFRKAIVALDPGEVEVRRNAWFARSLHRWVVEAWLGVGEVERAHEVLALIPTEVVRTSDVLRALAARVADAVEATQLGESVYPSSVSPEERWRLPGFVPDEEDACALLAWYPGRVRRVDGAGVELVYADPSEMADSRALLGMELTQTEWHAYARGRAPRLDAFIILASYQNGLTRLFHWPVRNTHPGQA